MQKKRRKRLLIGRGEIPENVSRQRAWQIQQRAAGLCIICAEKAWRRGSCHCAKHRAEHNERERARYERKMNQPPPPPSLWGVP